MRGCVLRMLRVHVSSLFIMVCAFAWPPQAPFQRVLTADVVARSIDVQSRKSREPFSGSDGFSTEVQIRVLAVEAQFDKKLTMRRLVQLFAVLERVVIAVAAGEGALWKYGVPSLTDGGMYTRGARNGSTYAFLGRVVSDELRTIPKSWWCPQETGVLILRPMCAQIVPMRSS